MALEYLIVCATALVAAGLTLVTGFGLGSLLLPAFAIFFPIETAVAATAAVHLANNLFKLGLIGRHADWSIVRRFVPPAALASFAGAWTLQHAAALAPIARYSFAGSTRTITVVGLTVGLLIIAFALLDSIPGASRSVAPRRSLLLGGLLSGFFGGLSGHQGALRSALLIRLGLTAEAYAGTNAVCSVVVDLVRLGVYGAATGFLLPGAAHPSPDTFTSGAGGLVVAAALSAFLGSWLGARYIRRVSLRFVQRLVALGLLILGAAIALGLI